MANKISVKWYVTNQPTAYSKNTKQCFKYKHQKGFRQFFANQKNKMFVKFDSGTKPMSEEIVGKL